MLSHGRCTALSQVWLNENNTYWWYVCTCAMPNSFFFSKTNILLLYVVMLPELLCSHKRICGRYFPIYIPILLFLKIDIEDLFTCFFYTLLGCLIEVSIYEKKQQMPSTISRIWMVVFISSALLHLTYLPTIYRKICFFLHPWQVYLRGKYMYSLLFKWNNLYNCYYLYRTVYSVKCAFC